MTVYDLRDRGFDVDSALELCVGSEDIYKEVLETALEEGLEKIPFIRECVEKEDFKRYEEMGVNIFNVTKYGYQATPISDKEYNRTLSDGIVSVELSSDGATSAPVGKTFNKRYIEAAKAAGTDKYISPDKQIDASTALFPERTWFVKNIKHAEFPRSMDLLFGEMIRNDNYTVNSDPDYPQYMVYEKDTGSILPMTVENTDTESWSNVTFFDALKKFFKSLFELIKQAINEKTNTPA